jgi:hypothetical protein
MQSLFGIPRETTEKHYLKGDASETLDKVGTFHCEKTFDT